MLKKSACASACATIIFFLLFNTLLFNSVYADILVSSEDGRVMKGPGRQYEVVENFKAGSKWEIIGYLGAWVQIGKDRYVARSSGTVYNNWDAVRAADSQYDPDHQESAGKTQEEPSQTLPQVVSVAPERKSGIPIAAEKENATKAPSEQAGTGSDTAGRPAAKQEGAPKVDESRPRAVPQETPTLSARNPGSDEDRRDIAAKSTSASTKQDNKVPEAAGRSVPKQESALKAEEPRRPVPLQTVKTAEQDSGISLALQKATATPKTTAAALESGCVLYLDDWRWSENDDYAIAKGVVRNITSAPLESVTIAVSWYSLSGRFVASRSLPIKEAKLMPGQTAPFEITEKFSPSMVGVGINFKAGGIDVSGCVPVSPE